MSTIEKTPVTVPGGNAAGSYTEALGGIAAIILTILGLAHVSPAFLVAIATIAVGAALTVHSLNLIEELARLLSRTESRGELSGISTWSLELIAGIAGIVLGVLALLNVAPTELVAIATIGYGAASLMGSGSSSRIGNARIELSSENPVTRRLASEVVNSSAASQALSGLAAIVLGILALAGFSPVILILIALLTLGAVILLNGAALSIAVASMFNRL